MTLRIMWLSCLLAAATWAAAPVITGASPDPIDAGGPYFLLTITGNGFVSSSTAKLGAAPLITTFVSSTELKAAITPEVRALSGTPNLTVTNPDSAVSNSIAFHISPVLSKVAPSSVLSGSAAITLTINGIGFTSASRLVWNAPGKPAVITPTLVNSGKLTAVVPSNLLAAAASVALQISETTNDIFSASLPFDVLSVPAISSIAPNPVDAGGAYFRLNVTGNGFVPSSVVNLGGNPLDTTYISATQLQGAITPELRALSGSFPITVSHPGVATSAAAAFTVSPVSFALDPPSAPAGGPAVNLTVSGAGFTRNSVITFNGAALATTYVTSTSLTAVVAATALRTPGLATVQIADSAGNGRSATLLFTIVAIPTPRISSLSPVSALAGSAGFTLIVTGANCPVGCNIQWKGASLQTAHPTDTTVTATVSPAMLSAAGPVAVQLLNQYGTASNQVTFTVNPNAAVLSSLTPGSVTTGSADFQLTVNGTGFVPGSLVQWNDTALATTYVNSTQVIGFVLSSLFTLKAGVSAAITVVAPGGAVSNTLTLPLDPPRPAITSLSPSTAPAGTETLDILVTGTNFAVNCVARWNGIPIATAFTDSSHLKVSATSALLSNPGAFPITVVNPSGLVANAASFTLIATTPVASAVSPSSAAAGSPAFTLTVNGALFTPSSTVLWNGAALPTTYISASRVTAAVPANLTAGPAGLAVSNPGGLVSQPIAFLVNAAPPPAIPVPSIDGVVNAFSGQPALAPGALISIYGANFAQSEARANATPLPLTLDATSVSIGGIAAPLLFVSAKQINAQVPFELSAGPATLVVRNASLQSTPLKLEIAAIAPAILTSDGVHSVAVNYPGGALNQQSNPVRPGEYVVLYATGQGLLDRTVASGAEAPAGAPSQPLAAVQVKLGGMPVDVAFAGLAPGFVGLLQINLLVPAVPPGETALELTVGNVPAPTARLWVGANL